MLAGGGNKHDQQDVVFDPGAGRFARFKIVVVGPRNQYIRSYIGNFP